MISDQLEREIVAALDICPLPMSVEKVANFLRPRTLVVGDEFRVRIPNVEGGDLKTILQAVQRMADTIARQP